MKREAKPIASNHLEGATTDTSPVRTPITISGGRETRSTPSIINLN